MQYYQKNHHSEVKLRRNNKRDSEMSMQNKQYYLPDILIFANQVMFLCLVVVSFLLSSLIETYHPNIGLFLFVLEPQTSARLSHIVPDLRFSKFELLKLSTSRLSHKPPLLWNLIASTYGDCCLPASKVQPYLALSYFVLLLSALLSFALLHVTYVFFKNNYSCLEFSECAFFCHHTAYCTCTLHVCVSHSESI